MSETSTQWPLMVGVNSMSAPSDPSKPVVAQLSDASGRTYALMLSSRAAAMLCVTLSHYPPAEDALADAIPSAPSVRVDDFVPIIELEIKPNDEGGTAKILSALSARAAEGVQIRFEHDAASRAVRLAGIGEQQLDQIISALRVIVGDIAIGAPQVSYREQIAQRAEIDYTHKRRIGAGGEFARVRLVLEPVSYKDGVSFMGVRARGILSEDYIAAVERGVKEALAAGVLAGFPVIGVRALLVDGAFHESDSSPLAFEIAARAATKEALRQGGPVLLEPTMRTEIVTPEQHVDSIVQDLKTRRARLDRRGRRSSEGILISANVPAVNLFGYTAALRSMSEGRARYTAYFESYTRVPRPDDPSLRPAIGMRA